MIGSREEQSALEQLEGSEGWQVFQAHARRVYDDEFLASIEALLNRSDLSADLTREQARQAAAVRAAVRALLEYPARRVSQLRGGGVEPPRHHSRA